MHKLKFGHAALASDLIEEYRAPLVDHTVIEVINSGEIEITDFYKNEAGAIFMTKNATKMLTNWFSEIISKNQRYFYSSGDRKTYGFQVMLDKKIMSVIEAIERKDATVYQSYIWNPNQQ